MAGTRCRACRRYVLGWPHITVLILLAAAVVVGLFELISMMG
jgi:hypothetical protein